MCVFILFITFPQYQFYLFFSSSGGADPRKDDKDSEKPSIVYTVWSFDPVTRKWFNEKPLSQARKNFGLVACNQTLIALGGQGQNFE